MKGREEEEGRRKVGREERIVVCGLPAFLHFPFSFISKGEREGRWR